MTSRGFDVGGASMAISALLLDILFPPNGYKVVSKDVFEMQILIEPAA
jgi:hypothetical protein